MCIRKGQGPMGGKIFGEASSYLCPNKFCVTIKTNEFLNNTSLNNLIFVYYKKFEILI